MPLPQSDEKNIWPPEHMRPLFHRMERWAAWWANDIDQLQTAYGVRDTEREPSRLTRVLQRWFVGKPRDPKAPDTKLPIPIAGQLCQASADILFAQPPVITVKDDATKKRMQELLDESFFQTIAEAAEASAALGGTYLRATWDTTAFQDGPFTTTVDADGALPEFLFGRLIAVTFWSVVHRDGDTVFRHLERHELNQTGNGVILHGLYRGSEDALGIRVSLATLDKTAPLAANEDLGVEGTIDTLSSGLAVEYVANQRPNPLWRKHQVGQHLGRSDLSAVEHLLDQLAETMSDWMRARRVARARILMSKALLGSTGPGEPAIVNPDQEVYTPVKSLSTGQDVKLSDQIELMQPAYDPSGYLTTAQALIEHIIEDAGYSMQTFGKDVESSGDTTATEVESRERRTLLTRQRKIRIWKPALTRHIEKLMRIDEKFFGNQANLDGLDVEFTDGVQEAQLTLAQIAQAMYLGQSGSVRERVKTLHPDWDDPTIDAEVLLIKAEIDTGILPNPEANPFEEALANGNGPDGTAAEQ